MLAYSFQSQSHRGGNQIENFQNTLLDIRELELVRKEGAKLSIHLRI